MPNQRLSARALLDKIDWEGGIFEAIAYGIKHTQVPEEIADAWRKLEEASDLGRGVWEVLDSLAELEGLHEDDDDDV